jgi:DUF1009 family protein
MTQASDRPGNAAPQAAPLAIICGGGSLPFAVADAAQRGGRAVVLFPLHGSADPKRVGAYPHHWIKYGEANRFVRLTREQGVHDVVMIGTVTRPALSQVRLDWRGLMVLPRLISLFRGGDDHLLSGLAKLFEEHGYRLIGAHEIAPEILMPKGQIGSRAPSAGDHADIGHGLKFLHAIGPFDVGQAVVVADGRVLAVEAAEGTDEMLARLAALREQGRVRFPHATGVLVKTPKPRQDRRVDLPSIGPRTVEAAARAGLAGIAVLAGSAIVAEPERIAETAERHGLFLVGVDANSESA